MIPINKTRNFSGNFPLIAPPYRKSLSNHDSNVKYSESKNLLKKMKTRGSKIMMDDYFLEYIELISNLLGIIDYDKRNKNK